jgi:hypothetical protein
VHSLVDCEWAAVSGLEIWAFPLRLRQYWSFLEQIEAIIPVLTQNESIIVGAILKMYELHKMFHFPQCELDCTIRTSKIKKTTHSDLNPYTYVCWERIKCFPCRKFINRRQEIHTSLLCHTRNGHLKKSKYELTSKFRAIPQWSCYTFTFTAKIIFSIPMWWGLKHSE